MDVLDDTALVVLVVALAALLALQTWRLAWRRGAGARHAARARRLGARGEVDAERVLRDAGYVIEARQVSARYALDVDGGAEEVLVRADFLVRRGAARYVADAKGGERASRITDRATRRQLIEYLHAYDVHGALLVDATRGEVTVVRLGSRPARVGPRGWGFVAAFALGVSIGALVAFVVGSAAG